MIFYKTSSFGNDFIEIDAGELACPQGRRPQGASRDPQGQQSLGGLACPQGRRPHGELLSASQKRSHGGLASADRIEKSALARNICDRQRGVGADGVVYYDVGKPGAAGAQHIDFQVFNRDGGEAELSGNGMAGLAAVLFQRRLAASPLALRAAIGSRRVELLGRDGAVFRLHVEIGKPDFADRGFFPFLKGTPGPYAIDGLEFHPVSVGNPHAVVICREMPPGEQLAGLGKEIEGHPMFPKRVNVEFVQCTAPGACRVYFYERGVGPTLASSTGSAAVFAVLRRLGMAGDRLDIDLGPEMIQLSWNNGIFIRNFTRVVCRGEYFF